MKVVIVHDYVPASAPLDMVDTMVQVREISADLAELSHEVKSLAVSDHLQDTAAQLLRESPDLVFNLVETLWGWGRLIHWVPEMLDSLGMPYTGCPAETIRRTSNKILAKQELIASGLPTPAWVTRNGPPPTRPVDKYIIKSVWEHSSFNLSEDSVIPGNDPADVFGEIARRQSYLGGDCYAEEFIAGREFNIAMLAGPTGPEVLPVSEIIFEDYDPQTVKMVGYRAKWVEDSFEYQHTPRNYTFVPADRTLLDRLIDLSLTCWHRFGLKGWARVDFRVDEAGRPWILEINANPCLSRDAGFIGTANEAGLGHLEVIRRILEDARG